MSTLIQAISSGVAAGAVYALVAVGIALVYRTTHVINIAQGDLATLGAYLGLSLYSSRGMPYWLIVLVVPLLVGTLMFAVERVAIRPLYGRGLIPPIMATVGLHFAIQGMVQFTWGTTARGFPHVFDFQPLVIAGIRLNTGSMLVLSIGLAIAIALMAFLKWARAGRAMRSAAQDPEVARLLGVPVSRMFGLTFFLAGAIGALAGLLSAPLTFVTPTMGLNLVLLGLVSAIIGGFGSLPGAVVGGVVVGIVVNLSALVVDPNYQSVVAYVLLGLVLLIRPLGFFGEEGVGVREV